MRGVAVQQLACVASVSVWFRSKQRGKRVKESAKNGASERAESRFISCAVKTENSLPWSFFAPKPNRNACYAGYAAIGLSHNLFPGNGKLG